MWILWEVVGEGGEEVRRSERIGRDGWRIRRNGGRV
jgi:hypothetical protein